MADYRRLYLPGGTFFLTLVTYQRQPLFTDPNNISRLRHAVASVKKTMPLEIIGAVILPEHLHFLWTLPANDTDYSKRIGKLKVLFTQAFKGKNSLPEFLSKSRRKHRESDVWQRRFWEHTIKNEQELENFLNYIHYNPVKHGLVSCPHLWEYSSFHTSVKKGLYSLDWYCNCRGNQPSIPKFEMILDKLGE